MTQADTLFTQIEELSTKLDQARSMIRQIFIGQDRVVDLVLTTLLCGGHGAQRQRSQGADGGKRR